MQSRKQGAVCKLKTNCAIPTLKITPSKKLLFMFTREKQSKRNRRAIYHPYFNSVKKYKTQNSMSHLCIMIVISAGKL